LVFVASAFIVAIRSSVASCGKARAQPKHEPAQRRTGQAGHRRAVGSRPSND
jgi:hypothetical protein